MRRIFVCLALSALAFSALGQEFEVVSVKPNKSGNTGSRSHSDRGLLTSTNLSIRNLITMAYGIRDYQLEGPDWLDTERFDVNARFPEDLPKDREKFAAALRSMMQKMLAERFKLALHRDQKMFAVYGLTVAKKGIKFKEVPGGNSNSSSRNNHYEGSGVTMAGFAGFLSREADLPVIDMTGLQGAYEFKLDWAREARTPADAPKTDSPVPAAETPAGPVLAVAIEEQLGLKLEHRRAPIEVFI